MDIPLSATKLYPSIEYVSASSESTRNKTMTSFHRCKEIGFVSPWTEQQQVNPGNLLQFIIIKRICSSIHDFDMEFHRKSALATLAIFLQLFVIARGDSSYQDSCEPCRCYIGTSLSDHAATTIADCSHQQFHQIPSHLPTSITQLNLTSSGIKHLSGESLEKYANLEVLILDNNSFESLEKTSFPNPNVIQVLSLNGTILKYVSQDAFSNTPNLLVLDGLETDIFKPEIFQHTPRLQNLSLKASHALPEEFLKYTGLKSVHLYLNSSHSLPSTVFSNAKETLYELNMIADHLDFLPATLLKDMVTLRKVNLVVGEMGELPEGFFNELDTPECHISEVSIMGVRKIGEKLFCEEPSLSVLKVHASEDISDNAFVNLRYLKTLDLSHNGLTETNPKWFQHTAALKDLSLSFNKFKLFNRSSLTGLNNLESLDLSYNELTSIDSNSFQQNHWTLLTLDLSHNNIHSIEASLMGNMASLDKLDMSHNQLNQLCSNCFNGLPQIRQLKLNNNQLQNLQIETFMVLRNLEVLDLSDNNLHSLPDGVLSSSPSLKSIDISNNHLSKLPRYFLAKDLLIDYANISQSTETSFECDCTLKHFLKGSKQWPKSFTGECTSPPNVNGRQIVTLALSDVCDSEELNHYEEEFKAFQLEKHAEKAGLIGGNKGPKEIILILFVSCMIPMAIIGLLFFVKSMRGVVFNRNYDLTEEEGRMR